MGNASGNTGLMVPMALLFVLMDLNCNILLLPVFV